MKKLFLIILFILLLIQLASSQPPFSSTTTGDVGFDIKYPLYNTFKQDSDSFFDFHVYNKSTGLPLNSGIVCILHLYNTSHAHIYNNSVNTTAFIYDYEFEIDAGNFSEIGIYTYLLSCNNSNMGGFVSAQFTVSPSGTETTEAQSTLYLALLIVMIILFIASLTLSFSIDGNNVKKIGFIEINYKKHLKKGMYLLTYIFFVILLYLLWVVVRNFLIDGSANLFRTLFLIAAYGFIPIVLLLLIMTALDVITDKEITELAKRGLNPRGKGRA